jgi:hypothetical protein
VLCNLFKEEAMTKQSEEPLTLEQSMSGILALLVAERDERLGRGDPPPTDVLLADAGLGYGEISRVTGRPYEAVKSAVRRGRDGRGRKKRSPRTPAATKEKS